MFPDWPALTERERRVVHASVLPLCQFLPSLVARGYRVRILPLGACLGRARARPTAGGARGGRRPSDVRGAQQNEDEFFACAYTEYLARRYGLDAEQQLDDRGVAADVLALFEELDTATTPLS
ncbi:hypothetical protein [Archangium sp.]|uniref:hypothetical protein n=1 Tax=Archangium sp. TaxID=1872627 RepID=UPI002D5CED76|nr:hypothetical protein [Archangium sp.]HYO54074.1 hypothetical protein [Archangium sp.]